MVSRTTADRTITKIIRGGRDRTYTFPRTTRVARSGAFKNKKDLRSVRLNDGLEVLGENCFFDSKIRELVLPSSVGSIGKCAFSACCDLRRADLRTAHGLKILEEELFSRCRQLRQVLLNDELETIGVSCFSDNAFEEITISRDARRIEKCAFGYCQALKEVVFAGNVLASIGDNAFSGSGLEKFTAPASLCEVGEQAFSGCEALKYVDLSACLQSEEQQKHANYFLSGEAFRGSSIEEIRLP